MKAKKLMIMLIILFSGYAFGDSVRFTCDDCNQEEFKIYAYIANSEDSCFFADSCFLLQNNKTEVIPLEDNKKYNLNIVKEYVHYITKIPVIYNAESKIGSEIDTNKREIKYHIHLKNIQTGDAELKYEI